MKCPQCSGDHSLSQCPNWRTPGYRLLPVALAPHIRDALVETGGCFMPESLWAAIIAAHDLVAPRPTAVMAGDLSLAEAMDAAYPRPDSQHGFAQMACSQNRVAFRKGWEARPAAVMAGDLVTLTRQQLDDYRARAIAETVEKFAARPAAMGAGGLSKVEINREGSKFWHNNCTGHFKSSGIMKEVVREDGKSLFECLHCGKCCYYPVGSAGTVSGDEVVRPTACGAGDLPAQSQASAAPVLTDANIKNIRRTIIGLRDGWAGRGVANEAIELCERHLAATPAKTEG